MSLFTRWLGYGLGAGIASKLLREDAPAPRTPPRNMTEAEILADEKRFAEDERRIEASLRASEDEKKKNEKKSD